MKTPSRLFSKTVVAMLIALLSFTATTIKAQHYVTIPDTCFARILREKFPACMNGNQLDTTCQAIRDTVQLNIYWSNVENLTGLQYITGLFNLQISNCKKPLKFIPSLNLPNLVYFGCTYNGLTSLPAMNLPKLYMFSCDGNKLTKLSDLSFPGLQVLYCSNNLLIALDNLTLPNLNVLDCGNNSLTDLPLNYPKLKDLDCSGNQLTYLQPLPSTLCSLSCHDNKLTSLPTLPSSMNCGLLCFNNKITCFPVFPQDLSFIGIDGNPFTCLPNHTPAMRPELLAYPLCKDGDAVNNPYNCSPAQGILGYVFKDENMNCTADPGEAYIKNIPVKLYDASNVLVTQTTTLLNGSYQFVVAKGTYKVKVDLAGTPLVSSCKGDTSVNVDNGLIVENVNFGVKCQTENDIGIQSILTNGRIFPGQTHVVSILAGDMSSWYNSNCVAGISGKVEIKVTGPITYTGALGSLTPTVVGNIFTYTIDDFSTVTPESFRLGFLTNTNATAGNSICIDVHVTSNANDGNLINNDKQFCYLVSNSYDPNIKEVYPLDQVEELYNDWFTYTIHFQNTGNAAAINIKLADVLDPNLDLETFQVLNYSHYNKITLTGSALEIYFPDIELADSASNPEGSKGFIQYRIKPKANLMAGVIIKNKASIYFDFNAPIVTNTTMNHYVKSVSVGENEKKLYMHVYPNPGNGQYVIQLNEETATPGLAIEVYNLLGSVVYTGKTSAALTSIDLSHQPNGVYFIKVTGAGQSFNQRLIKQ